MSTRSSLNTGRYPTTTAQEEAALAAEADLLEQTQRHARASLRIADAPDAETERWIAENPYQPDEPATPDLSSDLDFAAFCDAQADAFYAHVEAADAFVLHYGRPGVVSVGSALNLSASAVSL
jgi:hypothetical protein